MSEGSCAEGREASPSAGVIDSPSAKTMESVLRRRGHAIKSLLRQSFVSPIGAVMPCRSTVKRRALVHDAVFEARSMPSRAGNLVIASVLPISTSLLRSSSAISADTLCIWTRGPTRSIRQISSA